MPSGKLLINTINAHSYNTAQKDKLFAEALQQGDVLIPDGASIVKACRWLNARSKPTERIAGWNLFEFEMNKLNTIGGKCFSWAAVKSIGIDKTACESGLSQHRSGNLFATL